MMAIRSAVLARASAVLVAAMATVGILGCAAPQERSPFAKTAISSKNVDVEHGIQSLRGGDFSAAIRDFNRALTASPEAASLHLLAGVAYHLNASRGNPAAIELAEVGYTVAARLEPYNSLAHLQLGRLYLEKKDYVRAQAAFAHVVDLDGDDAEASLGLAVSSYYTGDIESALAAIGLAEKLKPSDQAVIRAGALIRSAAGLQQEARAIRIKLDATAVRSDELKFIDRRMRQWQQLFDREKGSWHERAEILAQAPPAVPSASPSTPAEPAKAQGAPSAATASATPTPTTVLSRYWADCDQGANAPQPSTPDTPTIYTAGNNVDISPLSALPSPCTGRPLPRMLQIDATYIRTDETSDANQGVNVLQGLEVVYNAVKNVTVTNGVRHVVFTRSIGLPTGGITYALNIANANELRADILSRPTLIAVDRQPAVFFSGTNLTIAVPGQLAGGSLIDKPVGVSMAVTPTFVDDDTVLLAIKIARSSIELGQPGSFTQSLQTTRNMVNSTAILKFNQTLIISGLLEHEYQKAKSGVPLLGDIPGVQYAFSTNETQEFRRALIVTITPRRSALAGPDGDVDMKEGKPQDPLVSEVRQRLQKDFTSRPNVLPIMKSQGYNRYMREFREGDLAEVDWKSANELDHFLKVLRSFVHY